MAAHSDGAGHGATFIVKLPLMVTTEMVKDPQRRHPTATDDAPRLALPAELDGIRALVVDDEPDANEMVKTLLTSCGAEVRVAASTRQALDILNRWRPDVLVSDIGMPEEDGYFLIGEVRRRPRSRGGDVPAVALHGVRAGRRSREDIERGLPDARIEARRADGARCRRRERRARHPRGSRRGRRVARHPHRFSTRPDLARRHL